MKNKSLPNSPTYQKGEHLKMKWCKSIQNLVAFFSVSLVSALAYAQPQPESGFNMPRDVSLDGYRIDWLINITMVFCVILFVIMCIWMLWAILLHGRNHKADYDTGDSKHHVMIACTISPLIFFVVDGNLFYNSVIDLNEAFWNFEKAEGQDAVQIEVNGRQWVWDARYKGADGKFNTPDDIVTRNDIRVPVNTPIGMQLTSVDVIHSFFLPNLRVKTDAVPGDVNRIWFQATDTGDFEIVCVQHCGAAHYKMRGILTIMPEDEYKAWHDEASRRAKLAFDPEDKSAQWGWAWEEL